MITIYFVRPLCNPLNLRGGCSVCGQHHVTKRQSPPPIHLKKLGVPPPSHFSYYFCILRKFCQMFVLQKYIDSHSHTVDSLILICHSNILSIDGYFLWRSLFPWICTHIKEMRFPIFPNRYGTKIGRKTYLMLIYGKFSRLLWTNAILHSILFMGLKGLTEMIFAW